MPAETKHLFIGGTSAIGSSYLYALSNGLNTETAESTLLTYLFELFNYNNEIRQNEDLRARLQEKNPNEIDLFVSQKSYDRLKTQKFLPIFSLNFTFFTKKVTMLVIGLLLFCVLYKVFFSFLFVHTLSRFSSSFTYYLIKALLFTCLCGLTYWLLTVHCKKLVHFFCYRRPLFRMTPSALWADWNEIPAAHREAYDYVWLVLPSAFLQKHFLGRDVEPALSSCAAQIQDTRYTNLTCDIKQLLADCPRARLVVVSANFKDVDGLLACLDEADRTRVCSVSNPFLAYRAPLKYERFSLIRLFTSAAPAYLKHYTNRGEGGETTEEEVKDATTRLDYNPIVTFLGPSPVVVAAGCPENREVLSALLTRSGLPVKSWPFSPNAHEASCTTSNCLYSNMILLLKGSEWNFSKLNDKLFFSAVQEASLLNSVILLQRYHNKFAALKQERKRLHKEASLTGEVEEEVLENLAFDQYNPIFDAPQNRQVLLELNHKDFQQFERSFHAQVAPVTPDRISSFLFTFLYMRPTFLPFDFERYCLAHYNPTNPISALHLEELLVQVSKQVELAKQFKADSSNLSKLFRKASERDYE